MDINFLIYIFLLFQIQVALLINGDTPGIPRQMLGNKAVRGMYVCMYEWLFI